MSSIFNLMAIFSIEDSIVSDLRANYPFAFWIAIAAIAGGYVAYKGMKLYSRFEGMEKNIALLFVRVDKHDVLFERIDVRLSMIERQLVGLHAFLMPMGYNPRSALGNSPRELTAIGYSILKDCGGKDYIDRNKDAFLKVMEEKGLKRGWQVQNTAGIIIFEKIADEDFSFIQDYLFHNTCYYIKDEEPMDLGLKEVVAIMGLYLRDLYFEKHPATKI